MEEHDIVPRGDERMWTKITETLLDRLKGDEQVHEVMERLERDVYEGKITSGQAADLVIGKFIEHYKN
jgi:hypothetical protein